MSSAARPLASSRRRRGRRAPVRGWRRCDIAIFALAWTAGLALCLIATALVAFFAIEGARYLRPGLLLEHPSASVSQSGSGGFLDPIEGTILLSVIALGIAAPIAVTTALWVVEFGRPRWLARVVESTVEIIAGTPDVVLAIFGLALFELGLFAPLSFGQPGGAFGRSFITCGIVVSAVAIPSIYAATRNGLIATPRHLREASYALGKTKTATIRRVVLPAIRRDIATGSTLGLARIVGDTAIVILLLGATLQIQTQSAVPVLGLLRGTGSTLTSYAYAASPAGDGNAPTKAYAAAAILLLLVVALNWAVGRIGRIGGPPLHEERRLGA
jgi:phosphate transport system permease protein